MPDETQFLTRLNDVLVDHIPGCERLISADRLSAGASQETYRLKIATESGELLLALRRGAGGLVAEASEGRVGLAGEAALMRAAKEAGVPEPEVYYLLRPQDQLGEGFIMQWLDGETLGTRILRAPELAALRPRLAFECGQLLARIHGIDIEDEALADCLTEMPTREFIQNMWQRYQSYDIPQPMIDYTARWLLQHLPDDIEPTLVHNDFRNGNIMVTPEGIQAVLDWEVAHIGDPMRDLGWICTNSWRFGRTELPVGGFGEYADLFRGYESVSGKPVDPKRVHFWEVFGSFWWAVGCLSMAEHYRSGPDQTVERPAIGRRTSECQVDCVNLLIPGPVELIQPSQTDDTEMPSISELVQSVRDFLRTEIMSETEGRNHFLARVAANSLDIVTRDQAIGEQARCAERARLQALFDTDETDLTALRWRLVRLLRQQQSDRNVPLSLDDPQLTSHLRNTVVNQVAIDQPTYSGFKSALSTP